MQAIALTLGAVQTRNDLPALTPEFEAVGTPGLFLAGEVTGYALIATAVSHGTAVANTIADRLEQERVAPEDAELLDLVIVGAGPAGIACALGAKERGLRTLVLEQQELGGTVRTFRPETRAFLEQRLRAILEGIGTAAGVIATLAYLRGYPAVINSAREAALGADTAAELAGEAAVDRDPLPIMAAEDFAYLVQDRAGAFIHLGIGGEQVHSPFYDFNDAALPIGASYWARLVERLLPKAA